jgi:hypothetical protein
MDDDLIFKIENGENENENDAYYLSGINIESGWYWERIRTEYVVTGYASSDRGDNFSIQEDPYCLFYRACLCVVDEDPNLDPTKKEFFDEHNAIWEQYIESGYSKVYRLSCDSMNVSTEIAEGTTEADYIVGTSSFIRYIDNNEEIWSKVTWGNGEYDRYAKMKVAFTDAKDEPTLGGSDGWAGLEYPADHEQMEAQNGTSHIKYETLVELGPSANVWVSLENPSFSVSINPNALRAAMSEPADRSYFPEISRDLLSVNNDISEENLSKIRMACNNPDIYYEHQTAMFPVPEKFDYFSFGHYSEEADYVSPACENIREANTNTFMSKTFKTTCHHSYFGNGFTIIGVSGVFWANDPSLGNRKRFLHDDKDNTKFIYNETLRYDSNFNKELDNEITIGEISCITDDAEYGNEYSKNGKYRTSYREEGEMWNNALTKPMYSGMMGYSDETLYMTLAGTGTKQGYSFVRYDYDRLDDEDYLEKMMEMFHRYFKEIPQVEYDYEMATTEGGKPLVYQRKEQIEAFLDEYQLYKLKYDLYRTEKVDNEDIPTINGGLALKNGKTYVVIDNCSFTCPAGNKKNPYELFGGVFEADQAAGTKFHSAYYAPIEKPDEYNALKNQINSLDATDPRNTSELERLNNQLAEMENTPDSSILDDYWYKSYKAFMQVYRVCPLCRPDLDPVAVLKIRMTRHLHTLSGHFVEDLSAGFYPNSYECTNITLVETAPFSHIWFSVRRC